MPDYPKLGLRCGIEIHQQLGAHKMFCSCPPLIRDDTPHGTITRKIKAVAGELGGVDPAARHELLKGKEFIYEYYDTNCLVELDEEPPHLLNEEILYATLESALLLNAQPVDEIQIMRKTIADGSCTSGFQRTMLVATNGHINVNGKRIGVPTVCLEEDPARIIKREGNKVWYRLDRLGIPLVEVCTDPDMTTPQEVRDVAEKIGMLLRATGKVKRGLGTIRQDVNVSIASGERIEIKGVQTLNDIPGLVENECLRQERLIELREELKKRGFKEFTASVVEVSRSFEKTESKITKGKRVFGIRVPKFEGLMKKELMPNYRFGTELAGVAKEVAGLQGIFHSDELPAYGISQGEVDETGKLLKLEKGDAFVLVVAEEESGKRALSEIAKRCDAALKGVPKEVRRADGVITRFMRPLPGSARMYPETDHPLIKITKKMLDSIKLPPTPEESKKELEKLGLGSELANQLVRSRVLLDFLSLSKELKLRPSVIASALMAAPEGLDVAPALRLIDSSKVAKESIDTLIEGMKNGKTAEQVAQEKKLFLISQSEIKKKIAEIVNANKGAGFGQVMNKAMAELRGKADPETVKKLIEELL